MKRKKLIKITVIVVLCLAVAGTAALFIINGHVKSAVKDSILTVEKAAKTENADCIIVLGCKVRATEV